MSELSLRGKKLSTRIKCSGGIPSLYCPIAGQIVVLYEGKNVEVGNHESLTASCGKYYELMKNQLEIGN